jgi:hypothetical protein
LGRKENPAADRKREIQQMEIIMENNESIIYKKAKKKAKEIRAFYINLMCYCTVIPIIIFINLYYMPEFYWFYFSMLGWGIGLFFHAMGAFEWNPFLGKNWEDRKLKQFMEEEQARKNKPKNTTNQ